MMTAVQIGNLEKAVELARRPAACLYADDDGPCCVIGQLLALEGADIDILRANSNCTVGYLDSDATHTERCGLARLLQGYYMPLLRCLQSVWDDRSRAPEGQRDPEDYRQVLRQTLANGLQAADTMPW